MDGGGGASERSGGRCAVHGTLCGVQWVGGDQVGRGSRNVDVQGTHRGGGGPSTEQVQARAAPRQDACRARGYR